MSRTIRNTIRVNLSSNTFSIEGEKSLFDKIVADQEKYAGLLRPTKNWDLEIGGHNGEQYFHSQLRDENIEIDTYNDDRYYDKFSSLQKMMEPFVGSTGLQNINRDVIQEYYSYLKEIDHLGVLLNYFEPNGEMKSQANDLLITDLGSIIDINIISAFLNPVAEKYNVLEVGGGYGRLAEVFLNMYDEKNIKYMLLDVVPASLMYSYLYLSKNFPNLRIGFYYNEDPFNMDLFDCYIMPAWHFDVSTFAEKFDCCINIQSMQEMNQYHIDYYLSLFNKMLKDGSGIAYISNEKDYIFRGEWNYPRNWKLLFKTRTPRSWTRNSPTEVFLKETGSFEKQNQLVDFIYSLQLKEFDRNADQLKIISSLQDELQKSQQETSSLQFELQKGEQEISSLQFELQKGKQEISSLQFELQKGKQEISSLQFELQKGEQELQKSRQDVSALHSTLSRIPLALEDLTTEKTEESIQILYEYYRSKELPDVIQLFENISKINAHLVAANLYLRQGRYRRVLSHLIRVGMMDPLILFSLQTIKIIWDGLIFHLRHPQRE